MEYNVIYNDCLNRETGLPTMEDKSIDLCLTDIFYNVEIGSSYPRKVSKRKGINNEIYYEDNLTPDEYEKFCKTIYLELKRICNHIIITPGSKNVDLWYQFEKPVDHHVHVKTNGNSPGTGLSRLDLLDHILFYGHWEKMQVVPTNVYFIPLNQKNEQLYKNLIHPCKKSFNLWNRLLTDYLYPVPRKNNGRRPVKKVMDCFLGSGTTLEICIIHDVDFIGFERKKVYKQDIEKRIEIGNIKRKKYVRDSKLTQKPLTNWSDKDGKTKI